MSIPLTHHAYCDFRQSVVEGAPHRPCDCWLDDSTPEPSDDRELLTWLIVNDASFGTMGHLVEVAAGVPVWRDTRFVRVPCRFCYEWHCYDGEDERAAIRVAMEAPPCGECPEHGCTNSRSIREHGAHSPMKVLEERNASLLAALYQGSPTASTLRAAVDQRIATAGFLTKESRAAFALRDLLDTLVGEP